MDIFVNGDKAMSEAITKSWASAKHGPLQQEVILHMSLWDLHKILPLPRYPILFKMLSSATSVTNNAIVPDNQD